MKAGAIIIEFLGTFIFLSTIVATGQPLVIGLVLALLIYLGLDVSGGHFNPAVTAMELFNHGIDAENALGYVIAQVSGGIFAISLYNAMMKYHKKK